MRLLSMLAELDARWVCLGVFAFLLILLLVFSYRRPYALGNSLLLLLTFLAAVTAVASLFGESYASFLMYAALAVLALFAIVPIMLIWNGILMMRREAFSISNILSFLTGLFILGGEIAVAVFLLRGAPGTENGWTVLVLPLFGATVFYGASLLLAFVLYALFLPLLPHRKRFVTIIIHGCALIRGDQVSRILGSRIDKAIEVYRKSRGTAHFIASGGQGDDETISEAEAMKRYLLAKGVPQAVIFKEDKSCTSRENLIFAEKLKEELGLVGKTALVTSNYHLFRCLRLAHELGIRCTGFGAGVAAYYWPSAVIREFAAVYLQKKTFIRALIGYALAVLVPLGVLAFSHFR